MASGAFGSGDPAASPMEATPVTRRSGAETRAGTSPVAKQARHREIAALVNVTTPPFTLEQITQEVHRMHLQGEKDSGFFNDTVDQINDHAGCLKNLRAFSRELREDLDNVIKVVSDNDRVLKENLKGLESIVTTQGKEDIKISDEVKVLRDRVEAIKSGAEVTDLQSKLATFETKLETTLKQLDDSIGQVRADTKSADAKHHDMMQKMFRKTILNK